MTGAPRQPKKKKPLVIDFNDPTLQGGGWLQPLRDAAEEIRLARRKEARKRKPKN